MCRSSAKRATASAPAVPAEKKIVRCAIYTRKSTEEGLQQEFNSLDAQREAGEAFIVSQKSEGFLRRTGVIIAACWRGLRASPARRPLILTR